MATSGVHSYIQALLVYSRYTIYRLGVSQAQKGKVSADERPRPRAS